MKALAPADARDFRVLEVTSAHSELTTSGTRKWNWPAILPVLITTRTRDWSI